jgi:autotransporter-associated beta strand protein
MIQNTVRKFASIGAVIILTLGASFGQAQAGVVTNFLDDGSLGTLRQVIANAASGETITFAPSLSGKTIILTSGQLVLAKNVQIAGPGAANLKISGNNASRVFYVANGITATISGLTIANGNGGISPLPTGGVVLTTAGANTLTGTTAVTGGTLVLNSGTMIPSGSATTVNAVLTTGAGGLVTVGSGTLTLSGANNYTGPTTVTGGTLVLNPGTVIPAGSAPTTVNTVLTTNAGGLVNIGSGTLVLTGANAASGSTVVNGGTLTVNPGTVATTGATTATVSALPATNGTAAVGSSTPAATTNGATLTINGTGSTLSGGTLATTGNVAGTGSGGTLIVNPGTTVLGSGSAGIVNTGPTTIGSGVVSVGGTVPPSVTGGTLVLGSGTLNTGSGSLGTTGGLGGGIIILIRSTGSGIYNDGGNLTVSDCTIANNTMGAGVFSHGNFITANGPASISGSLKLINCTVSGNSGSVGGLHNGGFGSTTVVNSTIAGNRGDYAGAIYNDFGAQLTLSNSTVSGNIWAGGPPPLSFGVGGVLMAGGTIVIPGAITRVGSLVADNTIFSNNTTGNFSATFVGGATPVSNGYNLSDDNSMAAFLTGPGDLNNTPAGLDVDAQGKPRLQDNGGPTPTIALLPGSAAIDKGDPAFNPNPSLPSDQRGFPRVANGRLDIGAFETQTPRSLTIAVQRALQAIPATTDPTGRALRLVLDCINFSLQPAFWVDETHLTVWGRWVFLADWAGVEALTRIVNAHGPLAADAQHWIDYLAEADEVLAKAAIHDAATGDPKKLAAANQEFATAEQALGQDNFRQAITHFAQAWAQAQMAIRRTPFVPAGL